MCRMLWHTQILEIMFDYHVFCIINYPHVIEIHWQQNIWSTALFLSYNKTVCSIKTKPYITIIFRHLVQDLHQLQTYIDIVNHWFFENDSILTLTPSPPFSFLAYLLGKGGVKKWGFPLGFEPGTPRTTMHCSPMARHPGVAARAAISFPYETRFYDVIELSAFSSPPCWILLDCGRLGLR